MLKKISVLIIFLLGFAVFGGVNNFFAYTNEMEFCTSCHSMKINLEEYMDTPHYQNASGIRATCSDCHVPKSFFPKLTAKIIAAKDVYHEIIGSINTSEKYEQHRWTMASKVWKRMKENDSRECRYCHSFESMALDEQDRSARKRHGRAEEQEYTCIDCHKGVTHSEPDEPEPKIDR